MNLRIDTDACTGLGVCVGIRPDVFEVGDGRVVHLLTDEFTEADRRDLEDAVYECPTQALELEG